MSIVVVIPSRGRPQRARKAIESIRATAELVSTRIVVVVDEDDPCLSEYSAAVSFPMYGVETTLVTLRGDDTGNLTKATNTISMRIVAEDPEAIVGNLGDDQIARTPGWDRMVEEAMHEPRFVYGNDLFQGERLPCGGIFIHGAIIEALGWYALPSCEHLFIDNAWRDLGHGARLLTYLPEMVFEHVHPLAGKAEWDEGYERANNQGVIDRDRTAYETWWRTWRSGDVARIREALNVWVGKRTKYSRRTA